jgi:hypothetical protein
LFGASKAASASSDAAQTQAQAQRDAGDLIYKQFQETKKALQPYSDVGLPAFQEQSALLGLEGADAQQAATDRYTESPRLAFARQRGMQAVDQSYASRGALVSGARDKALAEYVTGTQMQDFNNYFNKLGSIGNVGLSATQAIGGVGSNAAAGQAQMTAAAGESLAGGQLGKAQAWQSGISNVAQGLGSIYQTWKG